VEGQEIVGASFGNANNTNSNIRNYLTSSGSPIDGDYIGYVLPEGGKRWHQKVKFILF
jgi:hypothetical protein